MSKINRLFLSSLVLLSLAMATVTSGLAQGKRQFDIPFEANTRDLHIQISNPITSLTINPAPDASQAFGTNQRSLAWNAPPGAGNRRVTIERDGGGKQWNLKFWLTTDGSVSTFPDGSPTGQFASLFIDVNNGLASIFGENDTPAPVSVANLAGTLVLDLGSFFDPNWDAATGSIVALSDAVIPAGEDDLFLGSFALGAATWLKIDADLDGEEHVFGEVVVPEPSTLALLGAGVLGLFGYSARYRRRAAL